MYKEKWEIWTIDNLMISRYCLKEMNNIWNEENKFQKWLDIEIAVCEVLSEKGEIPPDILKIIKEKASFTVSRILEIEKETNHDVIAFLTNLSENIGEYSRFVHLGLTSSDIVDTAFSILLRDSADIILKELRRFSSILKTKALEYKNTIMIGRTHGIHAEPTTLGLKFLLWYAENERNIKRIEKAREGISIGKMSGAVGTYSNISPEIETIVCQRLGLVSAAVSTQIIQRDRHAEFMTTLAIIAGMIEKISTEIRNLQKTEVREVEEYFAKGQKGSSAMPHKRNPITCERLTGLARVVRSNAIVALENIALWHERDITHSSTERIIFPDSCSLIHYMLITVAEIVQKLLVYPEKMLENLDITKGLVFSQRVLLALIEKGITREDAYKIVQRNAMKVWENRENFVQLLFEDSDVYKLVSEDELKKCFDLNYFTRNVNSIFERFGLQ